MKSNVCINLLVMRRDWKESIAQLYGPFDGIYFKTLTDCRVMSIITDICELLSLRKKRQTVTFSRRHSKCWKQSHLVIHKVLKFLITKCLTRKLEILILSYSVLTKIMCRADLSFGVRFISCVCVCVCVCVC